MKTISSEELKSMHRHEGLIMQGCGGNLSEWVDGVNKMLTDDGILRNGDTFKNVYHFKNRGLTCLFFDFENTKLDVAKLAMWRLKTYGTFGGTWLSDYLDNNFGEPDFARRKPDCQLIGQDGNIFNLMGIASQTLRENGMKEEAKEMCNRITSSGSYDEALNIIGEYVSITSVHDGEDEDYSEEFGDMTS